MHGRAIVGIDDVTGGAAAAAIVTRLIVRAGKRQQWIEQSRLLQTEKNRIDAQLRAEASIAQLHLGPSGFIFSRGIAHLTAPPAAALEYTKHVAGLRDFPSRQWIEKRQDAL